jgi:hypothetical protein
MGGKSLFKLKNKRFSALSPFPIIEPNKRELNHYFGIF